MRRAKGGGYRVWLRAPYASEYLWPNTDVRYDNTMYADRLYRCGTHASVAVEHSAWMDGVKVRSVPNPLSRHLNDGKTNEAHTFQMVREIIARSRPGARPGQAAPAPRRPRRSGGLGSSRERPNARGLRRNMDMPASGSASRIPPIPVIRF